jgi:type II secretory pathway pseudopilin PulG
MKNSRKAVAMIELIFAIVIMGIAMLAIPMITTQSSRAVESAMMQESISTAASQIQMIMARQWDQSDVNVLTEPCPILKTQSVNFDNRGGLNNFGRKADNALNATVSANFDDGGLNDIDDYNGISTLLNSIVASTTSAGDYIDKDMNMTSTVSYANDAMLLGSTTTFHYDPSGAAPIGTTNIKRISVTLKSDESTFADKEITLNAFSCNIGTAKILTMD